MKDGGDFRRLPANGAKRLEFVAAAIEAADGVTCHGTAEELPYCNGVDCPDWEDCHGDKLRGYSADASNWREAFGL